MNNIVEYSKCECGAITVYFENNVENSMYKSTAKRLGIDLRRYKRIPGLCYSCNHCINHWGIDLCECGSGKKVGKCECGSNKPMQIFGEKFDSFSKILKAFSKL